MLSKTLLALSVLLALQAYGEASWVNANAITRGRASRTLLQSSASSTTGTSASGNSPGSQASASARARSTGGSVRAFVAANAETFVVVENAIAEAFAFAIAELDDGGEITAIAEAAAEAVGLAIAEAYTSVVVDIESDSPTAEACGSGNAEAKTTATAFAEAFVFVAAIADDRLSYADADAEAEAISVGTVSAFSDAAAAACLQGEGFAVAGQQSLATAIIEVYAIAFARALAGISNGQAVAEATSFADSSVETVVEASGSSNSAVGGEGEATAVGDSEAIAVQVKEECAGTRVNICCFRSGDEECDCRGGCTAEKSSTKGGRTIFSVTKAPSFGLLEVGFKCFC